MESITSSGDAKPPGEGVGGRVKADGEAKALVHVLGEVPNIPGIAGKAAPPVKSVAVELVDDRLEDSEKLNALPEWNEFSPLQRQIVIARLEDPLAEEKDIAASVNCSVRTVIKLQHSAAYEKVMDELTKVGKMGLRIAAIGVMKDLLRAEKEAVRLDAAKSILKDAGMLKEPEKTTNQNKKIEVSWKNSPKLPQ